MVTKIKVPPKIKAPRVLSHPIIRKTPQQKLAANITRKMNLASGKAKW